MLVKITPKRHVTFPRRVLHALGVRPGDQIELTGGPDGFALRPRQADPTRPVPSWPKLVGGSGPDDEEAL